MQKKLSNQPVKKRKIAKYSKDYKIYVIIYMKEHHLSNKAAKRMFLPNQKSDSAKTIREWLKIYNTYGPDGFSIMKNNNISIKKPTVSIDTKGKTNEELIKIINDLNLQNNAYYEYLQLLKKKNAETLKTKDKCELIRNLSNNFQVSKLIKFYGISTKTYYSFLNNPETEKEDKWAFLKEQLQNLRKQFPDFGPHKMYDRLYEASLTKNYKKVLELYQELELWILSEKTRKKANNKRKQKGDKIKPFENLLKNKQITIPFSCLATDGVQIKSKSSVLHYAFVIDLHSRCILSYKYSFNENSNLYNELLNDLSNFLPDKYEERIFHTDQGSIFLSKSFNSHISSMNFQQSTSAKGTPTDNSLIENFHGILKRFIYKDKKDLTIKELIELVAWFVNYYNYTRTSAKEGITPFQRLKNFYKEKFINLNIENAKNIKELINIINCYA